MYCSKFIGTMAIKHPVTIYGTESFKKFKILFEIYRNELKTTDTKYNDYSLY